VEPENDPANYKWGFYYNKQDARVIVPKRIIGLGWTFNFAQPLSYLITGAIILSGIVYELFIKK